MDDHNKDTPRKCSYYIYPERNAADGIANRLLNNYPQKERGRTMRAMMICGAALMKQDERLPFLIAEFLTEDTSMRDIQRIIHSTIPESYKNEQDSIIEAFLHDKLPKISSQNTEIKNFKSDIQTQKEKNEEETRKNSSIIFPDDE